MLTFQVVDDLKPILTRIKLDANQVKTANLSWLSSSKVRVTSGSATWIVDADAGSVIRQSN